MERLLDSLVAHRVSQEEHLMAQVIISWHEYASTVEQETVVDALGCGQRAFLEALKEKLSVPDCCCSRADVIEEGECRHGQQVHSRP